MSQQLESDVERVPDIGPPVPGSQPEYLETIGRLRSMQPAAAAQAAVLELGCGAGGNLLPLAERYPEARFLGIDASAERIETATRAAREVGLENVEFRRQDLLELDAAPGTFDYIVANNVYSRVDPPERDKLLAVCRDHLAPQGIVYVSYQTYPGSLVHDMLRTMMWYEAYGAASQTEIVARARQLLDFLQAALLPEHAYGAVVLAETRELAAQDDGALWQDHLAALSNPVYFPQFVEHARSHALQLAGDAVVGIRLVDRLWPSAEQQLQAINQDELSREMFRDVVANRALRQTLLCHESASVARSLLPEMLAGMYLEGPLRPKGEMADLSSPAEAHFAGPGGARTSTDWPLVKAALVCLSEKWPDYVHFDDLVAGSRDRLAESSPEATTTDEDVARLAENLLHLCVAGSVHLHSHAPSFVTSAGDAPLAGRLARAQARGGGAVANRRHRGVRLDPFDRHVLELLDGTRNREQLVEQLSSAVGQGRLVAQAGQQPLESYDDARRTFHEALPDALVRLAQSALLVG